MQPRFKRAAASDDEEDLELLRLAALQSLKPQAQPSNNGSEPVPVAVNLCNSKVFVCSKLNKRGRGFHGGRMSRNMLFNNRIRNSNLISVPTIDPDQPPGLQEDINSNKKFMDSPPKLILPQDRYCNTKPVDNFKVCEASSKFDRYNDSDNTDSDSETDEEKTSEAESPKKLERASSLEALMQELENEIQGDSKPDPEVKPKKIKKVKKPKADFMEREPIVVDVENVTEKKLEEVKSDESKIPCVAKDKDVKLPVKKVIQQKFSVKSPPLKPLINIRRPPIENCVPNQLVHLPYMNPSIPAVMPFQQRPPYANYNPGMFNQPLGYNNFPPCGPIMDNPNTAQIYPPTQFEPLSIKTDVLNTIAAPLSPRSAAFVLQNREIIERRKKSPRRSYSRSPSPDFHRSLSPRYRRSNSRSPSPIIRLRHSPSRRASPLRRASPGVRRPSPNIRRISSPNSQGSSRRNSPNVNRYKLSPPKRSSPTGRMSPKRTQRSPLRVNRNNQIINKSDSDRDKKILKHSRSVSLSLSPSPERFTSNNSPNLIKDDEKLDRVLEARKRKFEGAIVAPTEGIIRLKPKMDEEDGPMSDNCFEQENISETNEDELLGGDDTYIDFNVKVDDLFSDEESDNENEGRFKSSRKNASNAIPVLPFTQLLNGPSKSIKAQSLKDKKPYDRDRKLKARMRDRNPSRSRNSPDRNRGKDGKDLERFRSRISDRDRSSPLRLPVRGSVTQEKIKSEGGPDKESNVEKSLVRSNVMKMDRRRTPIISPIENKKIEIKIRNPSKYEMESRSCDGVQKEELPKEKKHLRKVEIGSVVDSVLKDVESNVDEDDEDDLEPEIIVDEEEGEDEDIFNKNEDACDLRAQLSRKRAQRQNKIPKVDAVPSRLLQNALEGAVFKKSKKSKSKKKDKEAAPLDGVEASVYAAIRPPSAKSGYGIDDINCSTASKDRKVRVLHCDAKLLTAASDGKLPIHLRLGIPGSMEIFSDSQSHKSPRKRSKNRGGFEQV